MTDKGGELMRLLQDLYSPEEALIWLSSPQQLLDGATPINCIIAGRIDDVLHMLNAIIDGVYA